MEAIVRTRSWALLTAVTALLAGATLAQKTPEEALAALQAGNRRFVADKSVPQPLGEGVRRTLARGQSPYAIVLTCADSRVAPEHLFNAGLGELFVIRVAGNTADPEVIASLEYAVEHLQAPLCVVLGHESCGAVAAATTQVEALEHGHPGSAPSEAMQHLLERIEPAVRRAKAREFGGSALAAGAETENVHLTVAECLTKSTLLRRAVERNTFRMVPAHYAIGTGEVTWLSPRPLPKQPGEHRVDVDHVAPATVPPHVAMRMLQAGHRRFLGDGLPTGDLSAKRREALTHGQHPMAIVLTCADSRVPPEHVFDAGLGELFVIRVAGNVLNDDTLASIEYAAEHTGASLLVVMGHTKCGAVGAAAAAVAARYDGHGGHGAPSPSMQALLARIEPAIERARALGGSDAAVIERAVAENVLRIVAEARERSPLLTKLESDGKFAILPTVYDLGSGDLQWLKESTASPHEAAPPAKPMGEPAGHHNPATKTAPKVIDLGSDFDAHGNAPAPKHTPATQHGRQGAETHGRDEHAPVASHGKPDHATATHATPDHGATNHGTAAHGAAADHHSDHGTTGHDTEAHAGAAHGDATHAEEHGSNEPHAKFDPIPLVGLIGVGSLLLAALIAVFGKKS